MSSRTRNVVIGLIAVVALVTTAIVIGTGSRSTTAKGTTTTRSVSTVVVQGGTSPTDSGLLQAVIEPGFARAYPQYRLKYIAAGTGQAITNAQSGQADAVLTHSTTAEASFVAAGYSQEPGGRLVMTSDFVTVGAVADPAKVGDGPQGDVTAAFREIARAGDAGKTDFVSRGDESGTNVKELVIWKQTGIPLNSKGEPGSPGTTVNAPWYHKTGSGQSANLQVTEQCPFTSGACYTLTDRGTFNAVASRGVADQLAVVSTGNTRAGAIGGADLMANPYHAYAVNPKKFPNLHLNLRGALAFLDYLTSAETQARIGAYPSRTNPAFVPDARPVIRVSESVPKTAAMGSNLTVTGTLRPRFQLDPSLTGEPVMLRHVGSTVDLATGTVGPDGAFRLTFTVRRPGAYVVFTPSYSDQMVGSPPTSFRQSAVVSAGTISTAGG